MLKVFYNGTFQLKVLAFITSTFMRQSAFDMDYVQAAFYTYLFL